MELELGLKITKTIDGSQSTDVRIAKDRSGPLFVSQETESMFILTAHLKGYKRDDIKININEDGTLIKILGEKVVQEMVMKGWVMFQKEPEVRGFKKMFKIPKGVVLDRIKANYIEEESTLTIYMPKQSKGKTGDRIEEVNKDKQVSQIEETTPTCKREELQEEKGSQVEKSSEESKEGEIEEEEEEEEKLAETSKRAEREGEEIQEEKGSQLEKSSEESKEGEIEEEKAETSKRQERQGDEDEGPETSEDYEHQELEKNVAKKPSKFFAPCFFIGTTLVASLLVLVCSLVRPKRKQS